MIWALPAFLARSSNPGFGADALAAGLGRLGGGHVRKLLGLRRFSSCDLLPGVGIVWVAQPGNLSHEAPPGYHEHLWSGYLEALDQPTRPLEQRRVAKAGLVETGLATAEQYHLP